MARKPAVQIICDRTGAAALVQVGVTLENMNEQAAHAGPALELAFRPSDGSGLVEIKFDDLCSRSDEQVATLVAAIASSKYFRIEEAPAESGAAEPTAAQPQGTQAAQSQAPKIEKAKSSRRTNVEIERADLGAAVEAASSMVDTVRGNPDSDDLAVADARELLREALQLQTWFDEQSEKDLKKYVAAARKIRKAGGQPKRPKGLPPLTAEQSERYGFAVAAEKDAAADEAPETPESATVDPAVSEPEPSSPVDADDDDIFAIDDGDEPQVDFL